MLIGLGVAVVALLCVVVWRRRAAHRPAPLQNDVVTGLVATACDRVIAQVGDLTRVGELAPDAETRWRHDGDRPLLDDAVAVTTEGLVDLGIEHAAVSARAHQRGPIDEAMVRDWLSRGIAMSIGQLVLARCKRSEVRLARLQAQPPPSREEILALRAEVERDRAENEKLLGLGVDTSQLPAAVLRKR